MNLADYLSELLGQHDEVSVPGLGYFVRTRLNASFNDREGRFYPPYHQVKFVPQQKDDDTFAQYVADKKNISLASSKYFVEKFIGKLREEASKGKFLFADLGSFSTEQDQLVFKPNDRIPADPAFYGYPPLQVNRQGQPVSTEQRKPVSTQPQTVPASEQPVEVVSPLPPRTIRQAQYFEEEPETKKGISIWLIILITVAVIIIGILLVFKFNPSVFERFKDEFNKLTGKATVAAPVVVHKDSVKKTFPVKDTSVKTVTNVPAPDSVKRTHFEAISDQYNYLYKANTRVKQLKAEGYNAYIALDAPGPLIKVSVGSFPTYQKADSVLNAMLTAGKIKKHYVPIEIPNNK